MSILGNTKKSQPALDRKNSAKLPKLTIQQQIDNNEVIERMNRKITFTKNQRHLSKTLQYVQALQNTGNNTGTVFRVEPEQLYFTNFEANKIYECQVKLVNRSKHIQRIKITPLQKKEFVVSNVKYPIEDSGDIAPGMQVSIFVRFKPLNLHDNEDELILIVGDGVVRIPIKAQREKCKGQWPVEINCGHCWVGDEQRKEILIPNAGGQAIYRLQNATQNEYQIGVFKIWPTELKIQKSKNNKIFVNFLPDKQGLFEQKIKYVSNQGEEQKITIKLKGGAYSAQVTLDQVNNQNVQEKKFHNCLYLNNCEPGKLSNSTFKIRNHAVVPVDYLWYYESQPSFNINAGSGKIAPSQLLPFTASFTPSSRTPKQIFASLYLYNLPKQSILNNSATKIINGIQMIQCLKLQVKVSSKDSNVDVMPLHKRICDRLFVGKGKRTCFTVNNLSEVERKFWVEKVKEDEGCIGVYEGEGERIVKPGKSEEVWFTFTINQLSQQSKLCHFLIHFDNLPSKLISIEGRVEYPNLQLYSTEVQFQLLRTNSKYRKQFKILNNGENDVEYKFVNPFRFYHLDFYDFYQFQDQMFYKDRLKIVEKNEDNQERECGQWGVVRAGEQKTVIFQISTMEEGEVDLDLELLIKDGGKYEIKVSGQIQCAEARLSQTYIPLKQLFQGNIYNSNKFLPKELAIQNTGNIRIRYEIIKKQIEECLINISQLAGIVEPKSRKRINLILQPLKTGPFSPTFQVNFYDDQPLYGNEGDDSKDGKVVEIEPQGRKSLIKSCELKIEGKIRGVQTAYYIKDPARAKKVAQKLSAEDGHNSVKMSNYSYKSGSASRSVYLQSYKIVYPPLQQLNFYNCQINKVQQQQILIQNNSELTTQFEIHAQNFHSTVKPDQQKDKQKSGTMMGTEEKQLAFTSVMGKSYIQGRVLNQAQKIYLSNNKGISIMCEPMSGVLHKKQTQKIVVTMFNDTSGKFKDNLVISIKDHEVRKFPINMQIKGTPVSLSRNQLGINFNSQIPLLNAGTFLTGNEKSTRNIKLCNNGPRQVQIKWVIYPYGTTNQDSDIFNISITGAQTGSGKLVQTMWQAVKPAPLKNPPFNITPNVKILKGREEANFTLNIEACSQAKNIQCLVIGEPLMIQENGKIPMEQLAIVVQSDIVSPKLKIDQKHENHINKFEKFAVVGNQYRIKSTDFHRKLKLKNTQRCNVSFIVEVKTLTKCQQCFQIVSTSTDSPLNKLKPKGLTSSIASNSKTNQKITNLNGSIIQTEIDKEFVLPYQSYAEIGIDLKGNPKDVEDWPMEDKVRRDGELVVKYNNGEVQVIPLVGWLYRPFIFIEMPNSRQHSSQNLLIDFGVVHVNNHKKQSIYLANPSKSAADWTISYVKYNQTKKIAFQKQLWTDLDYEDEKITDQKKCFRLSHDSGHLLAETIPIHYIPGTLALQNQDDNHAATHKPFKLDLVFKPESNVLYKSKFIIKVEHALSYQIIVRGRGTFEQQAQIK